MKDIYSNHKDFWTKDNIFSLGSSLLLLIIALFIQKASDIYIRSIQSQAVGDILLNNIPVWDIDGIIILSTLLFTATIVCLLITRPRYVLFTIKSIALFVIIRAFFISLTHLGVNPHEIVFDPGNIGFWFYDFLYNTKNDFFFSGHTGLPFLMALIFYNDSFWRKVFFTTSLVFGISVIIAHMHYSIDVFAAPFITYSIYTIAEKIFKKDRMLINSILAKN
ncbi:MAG: phosphatase PAP2-related protein [Candidatus Gracilibacteria bacterium]